ncbi:hypothetical protein [Williamsia soli]|uniref:hypothetical protein n=1 Tax=Williamsia soli TaxID=364929 RepID=UPI001A9D3EA7|nr:hypothetical protein [Williamsia soli]
MSGENATEKRARLVLETVLGVPLGRVDPGAGGQASPDFRCVRPAMAVEVKELTSEDYKSLSRAADREAERLHTAVPGLTKLWMIIIVARNAEEELDRHWGAAPDQPYLKKLAKQLRPHLLVLEAAGIQDYRTAQWFSRDPAVRAACAAVATLVRNGTCSAGEPIGEFGPGVMGAASAIGYVRSPDPNSLVGLLNRWLSRRGTNLRDSLRDEPGEHHAVIVLDRRTVAEVDAAEEHGDSYIPDARLELPDEIDSLWVIAGAITFRYSSATAVWQRIVI